MNDPYDVPWAMKKTQQVFFHSKATETEISESLFVAPEPFSTEVGIRAMGTF